MEHRRGLRRRRRGHYQVYLHDCAADGTGCVLALASDNHVDRWNGGIADWVFKDISLGTIDHTFAAGRMLRVRLMFDHNPMWVALSQHRPTRIVFDVP